jgi:hypothetical protein
MALLSLGCECTPDCPPISGTPGPPGPTGPAGAVGPTGIDGQNAFGITTAPFVVPAVGSNVNVEVDPAEWATPNQVVYILGTGYYQVAFVSTLSVMVLTNLGYPNNLAPGTQVGTGQQVAPSGLQGPQGPPWVLTSPLQISLGGTAGNTAQIGFDNLSPLTGPGQVIGHDSAHNVAVTSGGNGQVLLTDSTTPSGLRFAPPTDIQLTFDEIAPTTTKGDLIAYNGTTNVRVPVPSKTGLVLTVDPLAAPGVSWQIAPTFSFNRKTYAAPVVLLTGVESMVSIEPQTPTAATHVVLAPATNWQTSMVVIKDETGTADQFPITITTSDGTLIQGQSSYLIDIPYGKVFIYSAGNGFFCL